MRTGGVRRRGLCCVLVVVVMVVVVTMVGRLMRWKAKSAKRLGAVENVDGRERKRTVSRPRDVVGRVQSKRHNFQRGRRQPIKSRARRVKRTAHPTHELCIEKENERDGEVDSKVGGRPSERERQIL